MGSADPGVTRTMQRWAWTNTCHPDHRGTSVALLSPWNGEDFRTTNHPRLISGDPGRAGSRLPGNTGPDLEQACPTHWPALHPER